MTPSALNIPMPPVIPAPTTQSIVAAMSEADLRANLCTVDWRGRAFKEAALNELLRRQRIEIDEAIATWDGGRSI